MKNKKKVVFILPKTKGGAYYVYKGIGDYLQKKYGYNIEIKNTLFCWLKYHFKKEEIVFSVIPFIFRLFKNKFYYILVGNFLKERRKKSLGVKLLYFTKINLSFSNKIILMNKYLLKEINTLNKYQNKIDIIPNYIDFGKYNEVRKNNLQKLKNNKLNNDEEINILTITGFKFFDKAKGIVNLKKVLVKLLKKYPNKSIIWNIAGNSDNEIFRKVKQNFDSIVNNNNLEINWLGWIDENELFDEYKKNDLFLYWTELDVFPTVLLEVGAAGLPMLVNNFESFYENIPKEFICDSEYKMLEKIENLNLEKNQKLNIENSKKYNIEIIAKKFINLIEN